MARKREKRCDWCGRHGDRYELRDVTTEKGLKRRLCVLCRTEQLPFPANVRGRIRALIRRQFDDPG